MIRHADSHVDHGLTEDQLRYLLDRFADRRSFFIETISLPVGLGTVPCGLYGPLVGDAVIDEAAVTYAVRGARAWASRLVDLPARAQREVTVIAGPHEGRCLTCGGGDSRTAETCQACRGTRVTSLPCVLYTAFGGPAAPQEPNDPSCKDPGQSAAFWRQHALAK